MDELLSCEVVAKRYSVEVATIWRWIREKKLPAIKIGKNYRLPRAALLDFEAENRIGWKHQMGATNEKADNAKGGTHD